MFPLEEEFLKLLAIEHLTLGQLLSLMMKTSVIRRAMEDWMQKISQYQDGSGDTNPNDYMANAVVTQLGRSTSSSGSWN
jgi:hypothetical protein